MLPSEIKRDLEEVLTAASEGAQPAGQLDGRPWPTFSAEDVEEMDGVFEWRARVRDKGAEEGPRVLALANDELSAALRELRGDALVGVLDYLLDAAHEELERDAGRPLAITQAVLGVLDSVEVPPGAETFARLLRARAWKEEANALHAAGELNDALAATQRGIGILGRNPAFAMERADLELVESYIRHKQGDADTALARVRACTSVYLSHGNLRRAVRSRTTEATLLYEQRLYPEAETVWRAAYDDAKRLDDIETHARIKNNLGHCAFQRGDYATAMSYFTTALIDFEELRMDAERPRALWGIARVHAKNGRVADAVAELDGVKADFLTRGMVLEAALVSLASVEVLVTIDRVSLFPSVYEELAATFERAGMTGNALRALAYVEDQARNQRVTTADVTRVRTFMRNLKANPALTFAA
jgi:tetratricopeptide (TPR) repeat protein